MTEADINQAVCVLTEEVAKFGGDHGAEELTSPTVNLKTINDLAAALLAKFPYSGRGTVMDLVDEVLAEMEKKTPFPGGDAADLMYAGLIVQTMLLAKAGEVILLLSKEPQGKVS